MEIEELELGTRAYSALKNAGKDTVEDLCLHTAHQLLGLGNLGKKSQDVIQILEGHSHSLHAEPADRRLVLSCPGEGSRFNLGLSNGEPGPGKPCAILEDSLIDALKEFYAEPRSFAFISCKRILDIVFRSLRESDAFQGRVF